MSKDIYVYPYSKTTAARDSELQLWTRSNEENIACARAIEREIKNSFDGSYMDVNAVRNVIGEFGYDRVNWVLAANIKSQWSDGQISPENKTWANRFALPVDKKERSAYVVGIPPAALSAFTDQARQAWEDLGLFTFGHCLDDSSKQNFEGKVLVLAPEMLSDEHKSPRNQLIYATSGFGCKPDSSGRKVFGAFLTDGEKCQYNRADFIGVLNEIHLPYWAREKLAELSQGRISSYQTEQGDEREQPDADQEQDQSPGLSM